MHHAIAYYRVSTARQGRSGLGIEAQRAAVARFAEAERYTLVGEFTEVETGKGAEDAVAWRKEGRLL
jgi:DNA invertase Pin-like site-specific DNA recombinase